MKLVLDQRYKDAVGWNWTLTRMLAASGAFSIATREFPQLTRLPGIKRASNFTLFEVDDRLIALDTWDTHEPTGIFRQDGLFKPGGLLSNITLLLKLQHYPGEYWSSFAREYGIPVSPWTIMPAADFPLESFCWRPGQHRWTGTLLGKNTRFGRPPWVTFAKGMEDIFQVPHADKVPMNIFIDILSQCRWGIILAGKHRDSDRKNRRETEFTSCGLPLALNYAPNHVIPMKPGVHYVLLKKPEDLLALREIDPEPYAQASSELWRKLFSPQGMAANLIAILRKSVSGTSFSQS